MSSLFLGPALHLEVASQPNRHLVCRRQGKELFEPAAPGRLGRLCDQVVPPSSIFAKEKCEEGIWRHFGECLCRENLDVLPCYTSTGASPKSDKNSACFLMFPAIFAVSSATGLPWPETGLRCTAKTRMATTAITCWSHCTNLSLFTASNLTNTRSACGSSCALQALCGSLCLTAAWEVTKMHPVRPIRPHVFIPDVIPDAVGTVFECFAR